MILISEKNEDNFYCNDWCALDLFGRWLVFWFLYFVFITNLIFLKHDFKFYLHIVNSIKCYHGTKNTNQNVENFLEKDCAGGEVCKSTYKSMSLCHVTIWKMLLKVPTYLFIHISTYSILSYRCWWTYTKRLCSRYGYVPC